MAKKKIIWFHELPASGQAKLEKWLVDIILDKTTKLITGISEKTIWIENGKERVIVVESYKYSPKIFLFNRRASPKTPWYARYTRFLALPERVELLLGIVHRPLFELYKKVKAELANAES